MQALLILPQADDTNRYFVYDKSLTCQQASSLVADLSDAQFLAQTTDTQPAPPPGFMLPLVLRDCAAVDADIIVIGDNSGYVPPATTTNSSGGTGGTTGSTGSSSGAYTGTFVVSYQSNPGLLDLAMTGYSNGRFGVVDNSPPAQNKRYVVDGVWHDSLAGLQFAPGWPVVIQAFLVNLSLSAGVWRNQPGVQGAESSVQVN